MAWHGISLKCLLLILLLALPLLLLLLLQYICYVNAGPSNATSIINQATQVILDNLFFLLFIVYSHSLLFFIIASVPLHNHFVFHILTPSSPISSSSWFLFNFLFNFTGTFNFIFCCVIFSSLLIHSIMLCFLSLSFFPWWRWLFFVRCH